MSGEALSENRSAYRASILTPTRSGALQFVADGYLLVRGARIVSLTTERPQSVGVHDLRGHLIVPGYVDAHLHYPQTRVIGSATGPLLEWLNRTVFPEEARFGSEDYARKVATEFCAAALSRGTTTVGAYSSSSYLATRVLFETLRDVGLRAVAGQVLMDQSCPEELRVSKERALEELSMLRDEFHGAAHGRLRMAVVPRFAISCSEPLLRAAGRFAADHGLAVMTHVAENVHEGEETLRLHPIAKDYLGVYEATGLIGKRTVLAHAIHMSASEWDRVAASGAKIAHCPDSNFFLGSGAMRLDDLSERGIEVGLGSDVAAGRSFDLRRSIGHAHDAALISGSKASPERLFALSNLGGADVLGLGDETGSLEPGKAADFAVLRLPECELTQENALRFATFAGEQAPVVRVVVGGVRVYGARAA